MKQFVLGAVCGISGALVLLPTAYALSSPALDLFSDAVEQVRTHYIHEVQDSELVEAAIKGMLGALDPHSSYIDAAEFANAQRKDVAGIGIELTKRFGKTQVISPVDGSPAYAAGIRPGDYILSIDGQQIDGLPLDQAVTMLRGQSGSRVTLMIQRAAESSPIQIILTRAIVHVESTKYKTIGNIGYVRITSFPQDTASHVAAAVAALKTQMGPISKGYIIDLRDCPGGLLDQAVAVTSEFLDSGTIVSLRGRNSKDNTTYTADSHDITDGKPIVVLINEGSAAGSEIVAGALQDNHRATILGTRSFGDGTIQTIIPLSGSNAGALRLTTAEYYLPSGRAIQAVGIKPDINVAQNASGSGRFAETRETDSYGHFTGQAQPEEKDNSVIYPPAGDNNTDFQLAYAVDRLNGK
ncbi:MAG TPA: S41 family peptidase [Rhizomicrobium sp.]|jgi:carboxyl-terminal processing protease|nr:S41 family peptidase [Rhizomicrobium sp.]